MAKINHNNAFETINNWIEHARKSGAIHLYAQDQEIDLFVFGPLLPPLLLQNK